MKELTSFLSKLKLKLKYANLVTDNWLAIGIVRNMENYNCSVLQAYKLTRLSIKAFFSYGVTVTDEKGEVPIKEIKIRWYHLVLVLPSILPWVIKLMYKKYRNRLSLDPRYYRALWYWSLPLEKRRKFGDRWDEIFDDEL
ncbi:MAG: hypothetical protein QXT99_10200 [Candidatus Nitrosotenuis sp.]